jgi:hypothetical protein
MLHHRKSPLFELQIFKICFLQFRRLFCPEKCELAAESPDFRRLTMCCYADYAAEKPGFAKKDKQFKNEFSS